MEIEWEGDDVFTPVGAVTSWDEALARSGLAAVRRIAEVSLGPFTAVYEIDRVNDWGGHDREPTRTTHQYLVEESAGAHTTDALGAPSRRG